MSLGEQAREQARFELPTHPQKSCTSFETAWCPVGSARYSLAFSLWIPHGCAADKRSPFGLHSVSTRSPLGLHRVSTESPHVLQSLSTNSTLSLHTHTLLHYLCTHSLYTHSLYTPSLHTLYTVYTHSLHTLPLHALSKHTLYTLSLDFIFTSCFEFH